jgi:hypothetical protein
MIQQVQKIFKKIKVPNQNYMIQETSSSQVKQRAYDSRSPKKL